IVKQAIETIPDGPAKVDLAPVVRPPRGEAYARVESPRGELGVYVVSDGSPKPYRVKVRGPSFTNVQSFPELARGYLIADAVMFIGALDPVIGEVDR
ncbi:MAG: NADH-quinone oxidoreductase subunit D, partial [Terriglobia bacterium]